ncbi:hypothetical protein [Candidatus Solirubrobacter pratensis]|nr:hypothetical protein [Candidatus Solirubrobacter pratensis]
MINRRDRLLEDWPTRAGRDRDEYPPHRHEDYVGPMGGCPR